LQVGPDHLADFVGADVDPVERQAAILGLRVHDAALAAARVGEQRGEDKREGANETGVHRGISREVCEHGRCGGGTGLIRPAPGVYLLAGIWG
jgi:hypothetical protein